MPLWARVPNGFERMQEVRELLQERNRDVLLVQGGNAGKGSPEEEARTAPERGRAGKGRGDESGEAGEQAHKGQRAAYRGDQTGGKVNCMSGGYKAVKSNKSKK